MNIEEMDKIDTKKMYRIYDDWPEIAQQGLENKPRELQFENIEHIVFAGMGGSGLIGDVISSILSKEKIQVTVVKGYHLPSDLNSKTLVITISISGNTKETLTVLENAKKENTKIIAFSSGGIMEEFCKKNDIIHQKIQMVHSPRTSFPNFLFTILNSLRQIIPIKDEDLKQTIIDLRNTRDSIFSGNLTEENISLRLSRWIRNIPLIYYPWGLQAPAIRFKNSLQENSKIHVITEDIIEACHNGIVSWEKGSTVQPILITGSKDYHKTVEVWDILKKFFNKKSIDYFEIKSNDSNVLSKIVNLIYILDYSSIYHAILNKIDPSPVESIDYFKESLQK
jgi:glucose/mannose-6-phosphate isomerase|tara:strand:+ start:584 stop:1597 length:1014 start_codon:yes stop_codon:yes gene_type:complete